MTIIDVAGATHGGAARWRHEAQQWVAASGAPVLLVGLDQRVEPRWLFRREFIRDKHRVAANNVSFLAGTVRSVLLRNHLHFLTPGERENLPGLPGNIGTQVRVVHSAVRRADVVVVPSGQMAERVAAAVPSVTPRLAVRHHPLTIRPARPELREGYVLFPSLPSAHKDLDGALDRLAKAITLSGLDWHIKVTATRNELKLVSPMVRAIGLQSLDRLESLLSVASAVYAPYTAESFGYPIAEGRAAGVPVLAPDTSHNREIGGGALCAYPQEKAVEGLAAALLSASVTGVQPDPGPFDAGDYFRWLTSPKG